MAKYKLNKEGIRQIAGKCEARLQSVKNNVAYHAAQYLLNFGYHAFYPSGANGRSGIGWSLYYAANWNIGIGTPDESVITPERRKNEKQDAYLGDWASKQEVIRGNLEYATLQDSVFVTNSVFYGAWLNNGGVNNDTHLEESHSNHFIELCEAEIKAQAKSIVKQVIKEVK